MTIGTGNIKLTDVTTEIYGDTAAGRKLTQCFTDATGTFNPTYEGSKDRLSNFKGYTHVVSSNFTVAFDGTVSNYTNTSTAFHEGQGLSVAGTVQPGHVYTINFNSAFDCAADVTPTVRYRKNTGSWLNAVTGSAGDTDATNAFSITGLVSGDYIEIRHDLDWGGSEGDGDVAEIITDITSVVITTGTGTAARTSPYTWTTNHPFE